MHALTKTAKSAQLYNSTNMTPIEAALEEIKSLKPGDDFSYSVIARKYSVHRTTLSRQRRAITVPNVVKSIN